MTAFAWVFGTILVLFLIAVFGVLRMGTLCSRVEEGVEPEPAIDSICSKRSFPWTLTCCAGAFNASVRDHESDQFSDRQRPTPLRGGRDGT